MFWSLSLLGLFIVRQVHADLTISTSTPSPCYGDVVTRVCHHPELASNPEKYYDTAPLWRENNGKLRAIDGTIYTEDLVSSSQTFLTINITVEHFRNKSFKYSCELALADENGRPSGEVDSSENITVDPVDQLPSPMNITTFSNSTTAVLSVSFDPQCCNTVQLTVDITTTSSNVTTPVVHPVDSTDPTNTTIVITDITEGVCYTASIQSVCENNNLLEDSGVLAVNFNTNDLTLVMSTSSTTDADSNSTAYPNTNLFYLLILLVVFVLFIIGGVVGVVCVRMPKATDNGSRLLPFSIPMYHNWNFSPYYRVQ